MGLYTGDLEKVQNLKHEEVNKRIKTYYTNFIKKWNKMTDSEKDTHVFGNGSTCSIQYVNESSKIIQGLKSNPTLADSIELAINVIRKNLEYSYHDEDKFGIKMGAYAHYIINNFNDGNL
jgi:hypothetical protein